MKKLIVQIVVLSLAVLGLSACKDAINPNKFAIVDPTNKTTYAGTVSAPPALNASSSNQLPDVFKITYSKPPSGDIDIILNGNKIGQYFSYGATEATANISAFKQYLRQGQNTLSVAPLAFGPTIAFGFDNAGPDIVVTKGQYTGTTSVLIEGVLRDTSPLNTLLELDLNQAAGYTPAGNVVKTFVRTENIAVNADGTFSANVDITGLLIADDPATEGVNEQRSLLFTFKAKDQYGYASSFTVASDSAGSSSLPVQSAVRVAVGDTFIESLRPIIAAGLYESLKKSPFDARFVCGAAGQTDPAGGAGCGKVKDAVNFANSNPQGQPWEDSKRDGNKDCPDTATVGDGNACWTNDGNDGLRLAGGINPLKVDFNGPKDAVLYQIYQANGENVAGGATGFGTVLLNRLKLKEGNLLNLDLAVTEIVAKLSIQLFDLGIFGTCDIDVETYLKRMLINGDIKVQAVDKKMTVEFQEGANFNIPEDLRFGNLTACGINLSGIGNAIAPSIKGLVANMLPGLLNGIFRDNLEKLIIGGRLTQPDTQASFDMLLNIAQMGTTNLLGPGNPYDLTIELESVTNLVNADAFVKPALGPVFYEDPIPVNDVLNSLGDNGTNLSVAVNSNMVNQVLSSVYSSGITHFTNYKGKMYFGANPQTPAQDGDNTQTKAVNGDTRIRLWPDMAPRLNFAVRDGATGGAKASVTYDSATLYSDKMVDGVWKTQFSLNVEFIISILINESNGVFQISSAGAPTINILSITNNTNAQIPQSLIQGVFDVALLFGGNLLADRTLNIDLNTIVAGQLSGKQVRFMSDKDDYTITGDACITFGEGGTVITPLPAGVTAGGDGKNDLVCQTINFIAKTNTAGVIGSQGRNLFFQMEVRDPNIPPAPALPRFDLDDDGILDYKDNCSAGTSDVAQAVQQVLADTNPPFNEFSGTLDANVWNAGKTYAASDKYPEGHPNQGNTVDAADVGKDVPEQFWGVPKWGFENAVKLKLHVIIKAALNGADPVAADATYYNAKRKNDSPISIAGTTPWLTILYSNASQTNSDANSSQNDRIGDLCEADEDKDLVFSNYDDAPSSNDNCPGIYNPDQTDTSGNGLGDACDVKATYVLLQSLGSRYTNPGDPNTPTSTGYKCLTHEHFKVHSNTFGVAHVSNDMNNSNAAQPDVVDCNPADVNQRWYIKAYNTSEPTGMLKTPNPRQEAVYQIFADENRNNSTSWQLVSYSANGDSDGHLRMAKMNNASTETATNGNQTAHVRWVFGLDPTASSISDPNNEDFRHPWIIRSGHQPAFSVYSCLFYNTGGWGPDYNANDCAKSYISGAAEVLPAKFYRWGILIKGTQLWNGVY